MSASLPPVVFDQQVQFKKSLTLGDTVNMNNRRIMKVGAPVAATDAVNLLTMKEAITVATADMQRQIDVLTHQIAQLHSAPPA